MLTLYLRFHRAGARGRIPPARGTTRLERRSTRATPAPGGEARSESLLQFRAISDGGAHSGLSNFRTCGNGPSCLWAPIASSVGGKLAASLDHATRTWEHVPLTSPSLLPAPSSPGTISRRCFGSGAVCSFALLPWNGCPSFWHARVPGTGRHAQKLQQAETKHVMINYKQLQGWRINIKINV